MLRTYWYDTVDPFRKLTSLQQWMDQTLQATLDSFVRLLKSPRTLPSCRGLKCSKPTIK
jgi:hypothetical protein